MYEDHRLEEEQQKQGAVSHNSHSKNFSSQRMREWRWHIAGTGMPLTLIGALTIQNWKNYKKTTTSDFNVSIVMRFRLQNDLPSFCTTA